MISGISVFAQNARYSFCKPIPVFENGQTRFRYTAKGVFEQNTYIDSADSRRKVKKFFSVVNCDTVSTDTVKFQRKIYAGIDSVFWSDEYDGITRVVGVRNSNSVQDFVFVRYAYGRELSRTIIFTSSLARADERSLYVVESPDSSKLAVITQADNLVLTFNCFLIERSGFIKGPIQTEQHPSYLRKSSISKSPPISLSNGGILFLLNTISQEQINVKQYLVSLNFNTRETKNHPVLIDNFWTGKATLVNSSNGLYLIAPRPIGGTLPIISHFNLWSLEAYSGQIPLPVTKNLPVGAEYKTVQFVSQYATGMYCYNSYEIIHDGKDGFFLVNYIDKGLLTSNKFKSNDVTYFYNIFYLTTKFDVLWTKHLDGQKYVGDSNVEVDYFTIAPRIITHSGVLVFMFFPQKKETKNLSNVMHPLCFVFTNTGIMQNRIPENAIAGDLYTIGNTELIGNELHCYLIFRTSTEYIPADLILRL